MLWFLAAVHIICWRPRSAKVLLVSHNAPQTKCSIADNPCNRGSVKGVGTTMNSGQNGHFKTII